MSLDAPAGDREAGAWGGSAVSLGKGRGGKVFAVGDLNLNHKC